MIVNYYAVVFLLSPPYLLRREPLFERRNQENSVSARGVAIANHCAIVNLVRVGNLLRRSLFNAAGSFGYSVLRHLLEEAETYIFLVIQFRDECPESIL